jgi:hypothetical protein
MTAPDTAQTAARIADWRPGSFMVSWRCVGVGSSPATYQRNVGARLRTPPTATETTPRPTSTATTAMFFCAKSLLAATEVWPRSGIRIAHASMTAKM